MSFIREENFGKISFSTSVILVVLLTFILGFVFLKDKYTTSQGNLALVEDIYMNLKREQLKSDVLNEIDRINAQRKNTIGQSDESIKQRIIDMLNDITIAPSDPHAVKSDVPKKEYVFIYQINNLSGGVNFATMLVNPNRPDLINTEVSDIFKDAKGNMFRKKMLDGIRKNQEVFVTYWYQKPGTDGIYPKLSYFKFYPEWNWVIAKGSYLDDLDVQIGQMQTQLRIEIKRTIQFLAFFLVLICIVFLGLAFFFSQKLTLLFEGYKKIQKKQREKLEKLNRVLKKQAATDPLTEIHNRAYFNTRMHEEISRAKRYRTPLGLILFDIDYFKTINDTYGHLEGDNVLKILSELCLKNIRSSDILARWGGEEFVILVPETEKENAAGLAEKLRLIIEKHHFDRGFKITCSFGVTHLKEGETADEFINRADQASYMSKKTGKNRVTSL